MHSIPVSYWRHIPSRKIMHCGNSADWKCLRVALGMGEACCNVDSNLYRHHIASRCARVVAREVASNAPVP